jgi:hypothetical protein
MPQKQPPASTTCWTTGVGSGAALVRAGAVALAAIPNATNATTAYQT